MSKQNQESWIAQKRAQGILDQYNKVRGVGLTNAERLKNRQVSQSGDGEILFEQNQQFLITKTMRLLSTIAANNVAAEEKNKAKQELLELVPTSSYEFLNRDEVSANAMKSLFNQLTSLQGDAEGWNAAQEKRQKVLDGDSAQEVLVEAERRAREKLAQEAAQKQKEELAGIDRREKERVEAERRAREKLAQENEATKAAEREALIARERVVDGKEEYSFNEAFYSPHDPDIKPLGLEQQEKPQVKAAANKAAVKPVAKQAPVKAAANKAAAKAPVKQAPAKAQEEAELLKKKARLAKEKKARETEKAAEAKKAEEKRKANAAEKAKNKEAAEADRERDKAAKASRNKESRNKEARKKEAPTAAAPTVKASAAVLVARAEAASKKVLPTAPTAAAPARAAVAAYDEMLLSDVTKFDPELLKPLVDSKENSPEIKNSVNKIILGLYLLRSELSKPNDTVALTPKDLENVNFAILFHSNKTEQTEMEKLFDSLQNYIDLSDKKAEKQTLTMEKKGPNVDRGDNRKQLTDTPEPNGGVTNAIKMEAQGVGDVLKQDNKGSKLQTSPKGSGIPTPKGPGLRPPKSYPKAR